MQHGRSNQRNRRVVIKMNDREKELVSIIHELEVHLMFVKKEMTPEWLKFRDELIDEINLKLKDTDCSDDPYMPSINNLFYFVGNNKGRLGDIESRVSALEKGD